jgi:hypothetical protein
MGTKGGGEPKPYTKRDNPVSADSLLTVKKSPSITSAELAHYQDSVAAHARAMARPRDDDKATNDLLLLDTRYETTSKRVTPKEGAPYWRVQTVYSLETKCMYLNHFLDDGEVVAVSNYQAEDKAARVSNSTVLWWQHQHLSNEKGVALKITKLRRHEVSNPQTMNTARVCFLCSAEMKEFPISWQMNCRTGEQFNALKGTPNGLAAIYLTKDWGIQLGITGIESIYVDKPGPIGNRQVDMLIMFTRHGDDDIPGENFG